MYMRRSLETSFLALSKQFPALLLTGPRQVGKTTMLQKIKEKGRASVTLDDMSIRSLAIEDPNLFLEQFPPPLMIDEIQYAPQLLPVIKMRIDRDHAPGAYWLTGSQQFQMMKGVSETLAGRVAVIDLLGLSLKEKSGLAGKEAPFIPSLDIRPTARKALHTPTSIFGEIWRGSFPALSANPGTDWSVFYGSYLQTYLHRDIRDLAQVGDLEQFSRFIKACAARTGQLLNIADLARDVDINMATAKRWMSMLVASFQVFLLPPFHSNITKRLVKTPKLYFVDTGLCSYLTGWSSPATLREGAMSGAIFETFVVIEILKSHLFCARRPSLYFFRDRDGREIDLLIEQDNKLYPVEIKRNATVRKEWVQSFPLIDRFSQKRGAGAVVCLVENTVPIDRSSRAIPVSGI